MSAGSVAILAQAASVQAEVLVLRPTSRSSARVSAMVCTRSELLLAGSAALERDAPMHPAAAMLEDDESTSAGATSHVGSDDEADSGLDLSMCPREGPCTATVWCVWGVGCQTAS